MNKWEQFLVVLLYLLYISFRIPVIIQKKESESLIFWTLIFPHPWAVTTVKISLHNTESRGDFWKKN